MNDFVEAARAARDKLGAALAILQTPQAGDLLLSVAESLARATGVLYRIEATRGAGLTEDASAARAEIRGALATLQDAEPQSALTMAVIECIAACLGLTHEMMSLPAPLRAARASAPRRSQKSALPPAPEVTIHVVGTHPSTPTKGARQSAVPETAAVRTPSVPETEPSAGNAPPPHFPLDATVHAAARTSQGRSLSRTQASPAKRSRAPASLDSTQLSSGHNERVHVERAPTTPAKLPSRAPRALRGEGHTPGSSPLPASGDAVSQTLHSGGSRRAPDAPGGPPKGALRLEANLGAHSPSNFYRGLSGKSVVDFGGLFVATYSAPQVGTPLWLTVTLPGGYEFTAAAVVRWTREQAEGDGQPGFGAELCAVSVEARKLVDRFTRNREPLLHDG